MHPNQYRNSFKMKKIVALLLLSSQISYAAVDEASFAMCAVIDGDLARLECFDILAAENRLDGPQAVEIDVDGVGKWIVDVKTNPIDDSTTVTLVLAADSGQGRFGESISLVARCSSNKTDIYINWNDYLGSEAQVLTRVGTNTAETANWSMSTDSKGTFHRNPENFIRELLETNKLVAQTTPYGESPVTAIFNLEGIANAIKPLRETCGW